MAKYATIIDGEIYRIRDYTPEQIRDIPKHKRKLIVQYVEVPSPPYDNKTHNPPKKLPDVISDNRVLQAWSVPEKKTLAEINAIKQAEQSRLLDQIDPKRKDIAGVLSLVIFDIINGKAPKGPMTLNQFKAYLQSKM
jgi:hypothetical protein